MDETQQPVDQAVGTRDPSENTSQPVISKQCTLWVHDEAYSKDDILLNISAFAPGAISNGALLKVVPIDKNIAVRDFENLSEATSKDDSEKRASSEKSSATTTRKKKDKDTQHPDVDGLGCFVFIANDIDAEQKAKYPNLQLSVSNNIANLFGLKSRTTVSLVLAEHAPHSVSHVELGFRDVYLTRADMWRMARTELSGRCLYQGQKLLFLGTARAVVQKIYIRGKRAKSGLFTNHTKPIFRSESARFVLYIQMSREMWDFDSEISGDIMFNKVVSGFLPELFTMWDRLNVRHLVTIVLFTRMEYDDASKGLHRPSGFEGFNKVNIESSSVKDFYRVVVTEMPSSESTKILHQLKKEFKSFLKDVCIRPVNGEAKDSHKDPFARIEVPGQDEIIAGRPSIAMKGNLLEAINMASLAFAKDFVDRDLVRTGISIVVISAGNALFEVKESSLRVATENSLNNGLAIDLVCLSPMPLHSVPLFKYRSSKGQDDKVSTSRDQSPSVTPGRQSLRADESAILDKNTSVASALRHDAGYSNGDDAKETEGWKYAIPHWVDVSFWMSPPEIETRAAPVPRLRSRNMNDNFVRRCRMYELQMMGLMENEMGDISIPFLQEGRPATTQTKGRERGLFSPRNSSVANPNTASANERKTKNQPQDDLEARLTREKMHHVREEYRWMNEYDHNLFEQYNESPQGQSDSTNTQVDGTTTAHGHITKSIRKKNSRLSGPADSLSSSPRTIVMDHNLSDEQESNPKGQAVAPSNLPRSRASTQSTSSNRNSSLRFLAGRSKDMGKALASTEGTLDHARSSKATQKAEDADVNVIKQPYAVSRQVRASLSRHVSVASGDKSPEPTQPIAIQKSPNPAAKAGEERPTDELRSVTRGRLERNPFSESFNETDSSPKEYISRKRDDVLQRSPTKLAPSDHLSPWLTLLNPCNPRKNSMNLANQFRRWQHVFPRPPRASDVKWKSLRSPAALPLTTEECPTIHQLENDFEESTYKIALGEDEEIADVYNFRTKLARELVGFRLARGFQLVLRRYSTGLQYLGSLDIFAENFLAEEGTSVYLSKGNTVHLICVTGSEVQITRYQRKNKAADLHSHKKKQSTYTAMVKREFEDSYTPHSLSLSVLNIEHNWNYIDNYIAGYQDTFSDQLRFWCARFVLIPNEPPSSSKRQFPAMPDDTDDEVYIEGVQKLTQLWEKAKVATDDRNVHAVVSQRIDPNPLALEFQTRDASAVIAAGLENSRLVETDGSITLALPFGNTESYRTSNIDIQKLAQDLQGEKGIRIRDRRWHFRVHQSSFVGFDLTSWLLHNFTDVESREEAVNLGNILMEKGLFQHVSKKHNFRDGHYYYTVSPDYRVSRSESQRWFTRKSDNKPPATPNQENTLREAQTPTRGRPRSATESSAVEKPTDQVSATSKKPKVKLSSVMTYDVDPRKRSYRPELIKLHYDRLYNPDSCYHLRIEWMNTTAKLVEDAIGSWITTAEKFGLRLVEVPLAEASSIHNTHPFRSPYAIELALSPPKGSPQSYFDHSHPDMSILDDPFFFYKAILRNFNFVLDLEAASNFPDNFDISYSWGKPTYKYSQYIHKSGVLLAQVSDEGRLLLLPNRLCNNRAVVVKESMRHEMRAGESAFRSTSTMHQTRKNAANFSPFASPVVRAAVTPDVPPQSPAIFVKGEDKVSLTPEQLKDQIESFCHNEKALAAFYKEFEAPSTPSQTKTPKTRRTTVPDSSIPTLTIPPSITRSTPSSDPDAVLRTPG